MIHIEANRRHLLATIRTAALRHAERPALVIEEKVYTYAQLFRQVAVICRRLEGYAGNVVGVTGENTMETYASLLAAWFTGKAYVILHPDYPAERNRQIVGQAGIGLVLYARQDIPPGDLPSPVAAQPKGRPLTKAAPTFRLTRSSRTRRRTSSSRQAAPGRRRESPSAMPTSTPSIPPTVRWAGSSMRTTACCRCSS